MRKIIWTHLDPKCDHGVLIRGEQRDIWELDRREDTMPWTWPRERDLKMLFCGLWRWRRHGLRNGESIQNMSRKHHPRGLSEGAQPLWLRSTQSCKRINIFLKHWLCGNLLQEPEEMNQECGSLYPWLPQNYLGSWSPCFPSRGQVEGHSYLSHTGATLASLHTLTPELQPVARDVTSVPPKLGIDAGGGGGSPGKGTAMRESG